tara:strand:+ start:2439 stop:3497 length:1059 start_codon:yes stop_codon:yes gene_type:complete
MSNSEVSEVEIDIKTILIFINRNKKNLIKIFSLLFFPSIFFISQIESTFKGNFKIEINRLLNEKNVDNYIIKSKEVDTRLGENIFNLQMISSKKWLYSEFLIEKKNLLLSAATLDPVYKEVKLNKNKNQIYDFDGWFKTYIYAQLNENILSINVYGKDKKEILVTLNLIQEKYKELNSQIDDLDLFVTTAPLITDDKTPNKISLYFFALISTFFIAFTFVFIKQKLSGMVYGLNEYKKLIKLDFLETISIKNFDLTKKLLLRSLEDKKIQSRLGIIFYKFNKEENKSFINQMLLSLKKEVNVIDIENEELIMELNKIIIFISNGGLTYNELEVLNFYIKIYRDKIVGWVFVE